MSILSPQSGVIRFSVISKLDATTAPTVNSDASSSDGNGRFSVGSVWIDVVADTAYRCVDSTLGAAVWVNTTLAVTDLGTIATQDANNVTITGGTISGVTGIPSDQVAINNQTGTAYTLVLADGAGYVRLNNAAAITLTIPTNASVAFPIGTQIALRQVGAGQVTIAGAGVTINTAETLLLRATGSSASLVKVGTDEWDLTGDLQAA